jgi:protein TonB
MATSPVHLGSPTGRTLSTAIQPPDVRPLPRPSSTRYELTLSIVVGLATATALFFVVAVTQMLGDVAAPARVLEEQLVKIDAPEIEEIDDQPEPPPPDREAPELEPENEPSPLTLDQLDIALNPGSGGRDAVAADFALPGLGNTARAAMDLDNEDFVDFAALDSIPRPIGTSGLRFPAYLRRKPVSGTIVLLLKLSPEGEVIEVRIEQSDLPRFDQVVLAQVESWRFTPPTQDGRPVRARARLPMPIRIR